MKDITTQRLEQLVRFQEQERRLLASDLHDSVAQDLAALSLKLQTALQLAEAPNGKLRKLLKETVGISQRLTGELSGLLSNLRSPVFEGLDLVEALQNLIADNYADRWEVTLAHRLDRQLSNSLVSMFAYRIVQEALQNARRHGKARRAEILLNIQNNRLKGRITDNGTGFDPSKPTKGTGISGMTERCELLGGRLSVKSRPGSGTTVLFELPV